MSPTQSGRIEHHTIFPIPADQRHGRARDLFTLWFGINMHVLTVVTGALTTALLKLPLMTAIFALVLGNLVGGVFMALHSAQGPQLGVPQMVQSRGQFGSVGAVFTLVAMMVVYVGFVASNFVVGAQSLHSVAPAIGEPAAIALIALLSTIGAGFGHDLLHKCGQWMTMVSGTALIICFVWILGGAENTPALWARGEITTAAFLATISICAVWQIAYAPYVSDYSRYLPVGSGSRAAFWASYLGCVLGSILPMVLGAMLGAIIGSEDVVVGLTHLLGPISWYIVIAFSLGISSASAMNIYCGVLTTITIGQTMVARWRPQAGTRVFLGFVLNLLAMLTALLASKDFLASFESFLSILLCIMAPWTAINLVDYYLLRHGDYDVASFFAPDGGVYGRYNRPALTCFAIGIAVQVPFLKTKLYTGPLVAQLDGVDASWLVGIFVSGVLYYVWSRLAGDASAKVIAVE